MSAYIVGGPGVELLNKWIAAGLLLAIVLLQQLCLLVHEDIVPLYNNFISAIIKPMGYSYTMAHLILGCPVKNDLPIPLPLFNTRINGTLRAHINNTMIRSISTFSLKMIPANTPMTKVIWGRGSLRLNTTINDSSSETIYLEYHYRVYNISSIISGTGSGVVKINISGNRSIINAIIKATNNATTSFVENAIETFIVTPLLGRPLSLRVRHNTTLYQLREEYMGIPAVIWVDFTGHYNAVNWQYNGLTYPSANASFTLNYTVKYSVGLDKIINMTMNMNESIYRLSDLLHPIETYNIFPITWEAQWIIDTLISNSLVICNSSSMDLAIRSINGSYLYTNIRILYPRSRVDEGDAALLIGLSISGYGADTYLRIRERSGLLNKYLGENRTYMAYNLIGSPIIPPTDIPNLISPDSYMKIYIGASVSFILRYILEGNCFRTPNNRWINITREWIIARPFPDAINSILVYLTLIGFTPLSNYRFSYENNSHICVTSPGTTLSTSSVTCATPCTTRHIISPLTHRTGNSMYAYMAGLILIVITSLIIYIILHKRRRAYSN